MDFKNRWVIAGGAAAVVLLGAVAVAFVLRDDDGDADELVDPGQPVEDATTTTGEDTTTGPESTPAPTGKPLDQVSLTATEIGEFKSPTSIVARPDDTALYVVEREGRIRKVDVSGEGTSKSYTPAGDALLDISDEVTVDGERGLLDIAFSPDGKRVYVSYSKKPDGTSTVASYAFDGSKVDTGSRKDIISIEDYAPNHNGGDLEFGPDGYLYFAMGDGGGRGDPEGNGQDTSSLLATMMRIDPEGASGDEPYLIPADNPFADGTGGRPEIWLYGVRNPWRFSFDRATGDLWIGDVGQNEWEEIDFLSAASGAGKAANLGWSEMEAGHPFEGGTAPNGAVGPIYEYPNGDGGCAVTGGVVYRGKAHPDLTGAYVFGDFCKSRLRAIRQENGSVNDERTFDAEVAGLVSLGQDNDGELYAVSLEGKIFRLDP